MGLLSFLSELFGGGGSQKVTWEQAQRGIQAQQAQQARRLQQAPENLIDDITEGIRLETNARSKAKLLFQRCQMYEHEREFQKAIDDLTEAMGLDPKANNEINGTFFDERGQLYQKIGEFQKAIDDYTEAIRLLPQDGQALGDAFGGRAWIYQEIGQHQKAIDDYSEAIDISIGFGKYERTVSEVRRDGPPYNWLYGRARSHAWIGELSKAKVYYTMAIDVRPDSYDSYLGIGWCYEQEGNLEKAAEYNAKANELRRGR